ncbi:MAG: O-antigen ligase family protein [Clostridia bacterium]|nr:O-antigen ligase family protein [Clostridia bacterium]
MSKGTFLLFLVFVAGCISCVVNDGNIRELVHMVLPVLIYWLAYNWFSSLENVRKLTDQVVIIASILSVLGVVEFVVPSFSIFLDIFRTTSVPLYSENGFVRICSTFINPIFLAMVVVPSVLILQYKIFVEKKKNLRNILLLVLNFTAVILTMATGAILSFLMVEFVFVAILNGFPLLKTVKILVVFGVLAVGILLIAVPEILTDRDFLITILTERVYAWTGCSRIFSNNVLFGCGPGLFDESFRKYCAEFLPYYYFQSYNPHSDYFGLLATIGLVGALPFSIFVIDHVLRILRNIKRYSARHGELEGIMLLLSLVVLYLTFHRAADDFIFNFRQMMLINTLFAAHEAMEKNMIQAAPRDIPEMKMS